MINALNLKLQVIITSFRLLKKPTQMYFLECKMLLIKYFSNTKAVGLETHESFSEGHLHKDAHCRQWTLNRSPSGEEQPWNVRAVFTSPDDCSYLYKLMVGLWYMHIYASQRSLRAQPWILLESKECRSSGDIFKYSPTSGQGVT